MKVEKIIKQQEEELTRIESRLQDARQKRDHYTAEVNMLEDDSVRLRMSIAILKKTEASGERVIAMNPVLGAPYKLPDNGSPLVEAGFVAVKDAAGNDVLIPAGMELPATSAPPQAPNKKVQSSGVQFESPEDLF